jgi:Integrase zinc binding domain
MWMNLQEFNIQIHPRGGAYMTARYALSYFVTGAVPVEDIKILIMQRHEELGHGSWKMTYKSLKTTHSWPQAMHLIWETIKECPI